MEEQGLVTKLQKFEKDINNIENSISTDETHIQNISNSLNSSLTEEEYKDFESMLMEISRIYSARIMKYYSELELIKHDITKLKINFRDGTDFIKKYSKELINRISNIDERVENNMQRLDKCEAFITEINHKLGIEIDEMRRLKEEVEFLVSSKLEQVEKEIDDLKLYQRTKLAQDSFLEIKDYIISLFYNLTKEKELHQNKKDEQYKLNLHQELTNEFNNLRNEIRLSHEEHHKHMQPFLNEINQKMNNFSLSVNEKISDLRKSIDNKIKKIEDEINDIVENRKIVRFKN